MNHPLYIEASTLNIVVYSLAVNSKKITPSQVNNADDRRESGKSKRAHAEERSKEEYKVETYELYFIH